MSVREETSEQGPVYGQSPDFHLDQTVVYGPVNRPNDGADSSAVGGGDPPTNPLGAVGKTSVRPPQFIRLLPPLNIRRGSRQTSTPEGCRRSGRAVM